MIDSTPVQNLCHYYAYFIEVILSNKGIAHIGRMAKEGTYLVKVLDRLVICLGFFAAD